MRDHDDTPSTIGNDLPPILAGAVCATAGTGAALAVLGSDSPLRAPFVLLFLVAAPAAGLFALLRGLEPGARAATAVAGAGAIDLGAAAALSGLEVLSAGSSVAVIVAVTALLFVGAAADRRNERSTAEHKHH
ncbi:hypothetical protein [Streptomyces qinzhouensis]|uniref:Uncharacterized protein n=1 Tax=Streptomyces qinzhouensis TaxID=2599401 RepID=A0A5B8JF27_9ACTN|nr:hypothetical protein [Streptomyces qinzhouensis]QDY76043.1 hypothetical protein FQU76_05310 [Streptomyces qinzhouensis]